MSARARGFAALFVLLVVAAGVAMWWSSTHLPAPPEPDRAEDSRSPRPDDPEEPPPAEEAPEDEPKPLVPFEDRLGKDEIAGFTLDENGRPLAGVRVTIMENTVLDASPEPRALVTNELGRFRAGGFPAGYYHVWFHAKGRLCRESNHGHSVLIEAGAGVLTVHMDRDRKGHTDNGGIVDVRVFGPEGKPVPRFWMAEDRSGDHWPVDAKNWFEDGVGRMRVGRGTLRLRIEAPIRLCPKAPVTTEISPGQVTTVTVHLVHGGVISGEVLSPHGAPIQGARLTLTDTRETEPQRQGLWTVSSKGAYAFRVIPPGRYLLRASHPGWLPTELEIDIPAGDTTIPVRLKEGGSVRARVTGPDGNPVKGASAKLVRGKRPYFPKAEPMKREYRELGEAGRQESWNAFYRRAFQTDDQGVLHRKYIVPGTYDVVVSQPGVGKGSAEAVIREGQETTVSIVLK